MTVSEQAPSGIPPRFAIERRMGEGAFGAVMVVWDQERHQRLALKRLSRQDSAAIYRFKQEFRALADMVHPNLVRLHELFSLDDGWCFTMDLIEGLRFDTWVRGQLSDKPLGAAAGSTASDAQPGVSRPGRTTEPDDVLTPVATTESPMPLEARLWRPFDEDRLRPAMAELATGVMALHAAGIIHRDLKPSNVLVRHNGQVVILDFGLVATGVVGAHESVDGAFTGTPAYMSPEQSRGAPLTAASDWYAVGVMLYESLTGQLPFVGTVADMLAGRATRDPRDPRALVQNLPADLCDLCMALLQRDPTLRPSPSDLARLLGAQLPTAGKLAPLVTGTFVGRQTGLDQLQTALDTTRRGATVVAHVHGSSGYGKTTLVRRFLTSLSLRDDVVILEGRCYERESVPFKALDELVDALGRHLRRLRPVEAAGLLPRDARALVRLFPSLGRLEVMTNLPGRAPSPDPHELRRRAFTALRETLARITDTRALVLFIDDVHWGDADSASLVRHLLAPPEVPPLLLIVGYRGEATNDNDLLRVLRTPKPSDAAWQTVDLHVGPLPFDEAKDLARALLADPLPGDLADAAASIARESGGSPLFVAELVRAMSSGRAQGQDVSLQRVLAGRIAALPEAARSTVEMLACSERPLSDAELRASTGLVARDLATVIDRLRDEHLIVLAAGGASAFELLHDKVRLAIRETMTPQSLAQGHLRLANTFMTHGADPETVAHHFRAAGEAAQALVWTERAADRASEALALDHAVELYAACVALATADEAARRVRFKLARALASAGRGAEAAQEFLSLADKAEPSDARVFRREAAEEYLRAGYVAEAMKVFGRVLEEEGLAPPRTPRLALASLLWNRTKLKLRGLNYKPRQESQIDAGDLRRMDACWVLGSGLAGIDLVRSANYHSESLLLALQSGEPYRVARSLAIASVMKALENAEGVQRGEILAKRAKEIATGLPGPHALGLAIAAEGVAAWGRSDLPLCVERVDEAIALLRERGGDSFREVGSLEVWFALHSLFLMGDLRKVEERGPACAREAEARGDRYTMSTARSYVLPLLWAARDQPEEARREADDAVAVWPPDVWYHQHWARMRALCFIDLYEGAGDRALQRLQKHRATMKKTMQMRIRTLRFEFNYLEGRSLLDGALAQGACAAPTAQRVQELIKQLHAEQTGLASVYAESLDAGLISLSTPPAGVAAFAQVQAHFEALKMPMHASAAQHRQGQLEGGDQGKRLKDSALVAVASRGVKSPVRFMNLLLPRVQRDDG